MKKFENCRFSLFWRFLRFQESQTSKSYAYAYVLLACQLRDLGNRRNREILTFFHFLIVFVLGQYVRLRWIRPKSNLVKQFENTRFSLFWRFLRFQESQTSKSYAYAYVLLACQLRDLGNRRNREILTFFSFSHCFCTWPIFAPKVNYA